MWDEIEEKTKAEALKKAAAEMAHTLGTTTERLVALKEEYDAHLLNWETIREWYDLYTNKVDDSHEENARRWLQNEGPGRPKSVHLRPLDAVFDEIQAICGKVPRVEGRKYGNTGPSVPAGKVAARQLLLCAFLDADRGYTISNLQWLAERRVKNLNMPEKLEWPSEPTAN